ncbi:hypothetical protein C0J52_21492 [Blattella germanica]|nr:hypothetical protein C0J52_21492 [Blattella germanica]
MVLKSDCAIHDMMMFIQNLNVLLRFQLAWRRQIEWVHASSIENCVCGLVQFPNKGAEPECEVTEVEVRVDPMLFLCALEEDGSTDDEEDNTPDDSSCPRSSPPPLK